MPLDQFEREGQRLEITVSWLSDTLWFVPSGADAEALTKQETSRGRVWTARELVDLLSQTEDSQAIRTVATAKVLFEGTVEHQQ